MNASNLLTKKEVWKLTLKNFFLAEAKATYGATWCESQKGKSDNWKSGCESGAADCRGGKAYDPGSGHSRDFHHGYDAGWAHAGCK
jgi:hypothetical protein